MDLNDGDRDDYRPTWIGRITKIFLGTCVIVVYAILMVRIFMSCESDLSDTILLDKEAASIYDGQESVFMVWHYEPTDGIDDESDIWVRNVHYLASASQLQCTIRVNTDRLPYKEGKKPFHYVLKVKTPVKEEPEEEDGYEYEVTYVEKEVASEENPDETVKVREKVVKRVETLTLAYYQDEHRFQYGYNRIGFRGVELGAKTEVELYIYHDDTAQILRRKILICGPDMIRTKLDAGDVSVEYID